MRNKILLVCGLFIAALQAFPLHAQPYPNKPVRLIAPFPPGGTVDFFGRLVSEGMAPLTGQPFVLENRPGAGGNLGADAVAKAAPDGYTLALVAAGNIVINPFLYRSMPFDPLNDLIPVFNIADAPQLLAVPGTLAVRNLQEFIALAKSKPGAVNYASAGAGTTTHLAMDMLGRMAGVEMQHIPYKGVGQAMADLVTGRVQALSVGYGPLQSQLRSGVLRAIVAAAPKRLAAAPDVPTSREAGLPGFEMTTWFGVLAPKGTSPAIVNYLNSNLQKVFDDANTKKRLLESGMEPGGGSEDSFAKLIRTDYRKWETVVKASGVKLEE